MSEREQNIEIIERTPEKLENQMVEACAQFMEQVAGWDKSSVEAWHKYFNKLCDEHNKLTGSSKPKDDFLVEAIQAAVIRKKDTEGDK